MNGGELRVLIEDLYGQIRLVAEGVVGTNQRLNRLASEVRKTGAHLERRFNVLQAAFTRRSEGVESRLEEVESRLNGVESGLKVVQKEIRGLHQRQDRRLTQLVARVTRLEGRAPRPRRES